MSSTAFGQLNLSHTGKRLPLEVLQGAAGHYIDTRNPDGPVSREYFRSYAAARCALARGDWT